VHRVNLQRLQPLNNISKLVGAHSSADPACVNRPAGRIVVTGQQPADKRTAAFGVSRADYDKFLLIEALVLSQARGRRSYMERPAALR
jgi:hypothetical protein